MLNFACYAWIKSLNLLKFNAIWYKICLYFDKKSAMKEFGYLGMPAVPLGDEIEVLKAARGQYLISNNAELKADIIAPEIDFYISKSNDSLLEVSKGVSLLYEARAIGYDMAKDIPYQKQISNKVVVVSNSDESELASSLSEAGFSVVVLKSFEVKLVYGAIGELSVVLGELSQANMSELECDIFLARLAQPFMLRQSGCFEIEGMSVDEIVSFLKSLGPKYSFKNFITYDVDICQYAGRRQEICARCVEACPSVAILKDDEKRQLEFSHVDCIGCGACVSVCPSGSLDYSVLTRAGFRAVAGLYGGKVPLVIACDSIFDLDITLGANVLPFYAGASFLDQSHFITLSQQSGAGVVYYDPNPSSGTLASIDIINQVYELKFNQAAVYLARNLEELKSGLAKASLIPNSRYEISEHGMPKREIFANRLAWLVGDDDLGKIKSSECVRYARVEINSDICTLCLSCVGACNVGALVADSKDNSIKFNPSICTACGYCEPSCAEPEAIKVVVGELALRPDSFKFSTLARDELFKCVECGVEFATKKSIERVASIMIPKFKDDLLKIHTLYCCASCKAKVMFEAQMSQQRSDIDV